MSGHSLAHEDVGKKSDGDLQKEMATYIAEHPAVQLIATLLDALRKAELPWWSPEFLRDTFPAIDRMNALADRPDLRQRITCALTGLPQKAARMMPPAAQAEMLNYVITSGDADIQSFENSFEPSELAVYMDARAFWDLFRERMPWTDAGPAHQDLIRGLLEDLLAQRTPKGTASAILTPNALLSAIDRETWQKKLPVPVRAEIDAALLKLEETSSVASVMLSVATPGVIVKHIALKELGGVMDAAQTAMGFVTPPPVSEENADDGDAENRDSVIDITDEMPDGGVIVESIMIENAERDGDDSPKA